MSELYDCYVRLKGQLAFIESEPNKHPEAIRRTYRQLFEKVEAQVLAYEAQAEDVCVGVD